MIITDLIISGFVALAFMWYHRVRRHDVKLWKPWAVLADIIILSACILQFLMKLSQGDTGEARLDLLFAIMLVICTWTECVR